MPLLPDAEYTRDELMDMGYSASVLGAMALDPEHPARFFASGRKGAKLIVKGADILRLTHKYMVGVTPARKGRRSAGAIQRRRLAKEKRASS